MDVVSLPIGLPRHVGGAQSASRRSARRITALPCAALAVVVLVGPMVGLSSLSAAPAPTPSASAAGLASTKAIPTGLEAAIHRAVGPGPMAMGTAPLVSGITRSTSGWRASAPRQAVSATISPTGSLLVHLGEKGPAGAFSARSVGAATGPLTPLRVESSSLAVNGRGGTTLVQGAGLVTTSYQVTSAGLEQRFDIARAPAVAGRALAVDLGPATGWAVAGHGTSLVQRTGTSSTSLVYGGLRTTDARGAVVTSRLRILHGSVQIVVDVARTTAYPLDIDPTWTSSSSPTAILTDSAIASDNYFGTSVAMSADGTTALVGADQVDSGKGAVYVFHVSTDGSWASTSSPLATLTNSTDASGDYFGLSVAMSADGTTALIGAYGAHTYNGAVYLFHVRGEGSWVSSSSPTATLTDPGAIPYDEFGISMAMSADGTTAAVGGPAVDLAGSASSSGKGAVYVFRAPGEGSWVSSSSPTATLTDSAAAANSAIGYSVAMSRDGTTALAGAIGVDQGTGSAYVFHTPDERSWASSSSPTATLTSPGATTDDFFGVSVAVSADGTTALIGNYGAESNTPEAAVFHVPDEGSWTSSSPTATLTTPAGPSSDFSTLLVAMSADGSTALVGAAFAASDRGAAYVFQVTGEGSWTSSSSPAATLTNSGGGAGDLFGTSAAMSADASTVLVGAPETDSKKGAAYVFHVGPPVVTAVSPNHGTTAGGTAITITGSGFLGATAAHVGGQPCTTAFSVVNATTITCDTPSATAGTVDVGVTTAQGSSAPNPPDDHFTYVGGPTPTTGYWEVASDGGIFSFGTAGFHGSMGAAHLNRPIVGMASTPDGQGYWLVAADGGIFSFGTARFHGSMGAAHLNRPIVGMASTPDGQGYWLVAADGGIFSFGTARFHGSMGAAHLNRPIVGMASTPDGQGYWLVAADGGIFSFGTARFHGSMGAAHLNRPIVGMASTPDGQGYWLVAADGGIFSFGTARFSGSAGGIHLDQSVVGMAVASGGRGYWEVAADGGVFSFGGARFAGSMGGDHLDKPVVGMAATG